MEIVFHPSCAKDIEKLKEKQPDVAARIIEELDAYSTSVIRGIPDGKVKQLGASNKALKGVRELRWKDYRSSVRVYFMIRGELMVVLHVDPNKRRTSMTSGTLNLLKKRRRDVLGK